MAKVHILHWNIAGSDDVNGFGRRNATRGDEVGRHARDLGFDVFLACEAGQTDLRAGVNKILGHSWSTHAKAIWTNSSVSLLRPRKAYRAGITYGGDSKFGVAIFGEHEGKKFAALEIHTDYRKPAPQAKQVRSIFRKFLKDVDRLGIHRHNVVVVGDFNWDGTRGDNPFKALADLGFVEHGNTTESTFMNNGRHLDGVLAHKNAIVSVDIKSRGGLSDHMPVKLTLTLK
jgi:hypothetical protein